MGRDLEVHDASLSIDHGDEHAWVDGDLAPLPTVPEVTAHELPDRLALRGLVHRGVVVAGTHVLAGEKRERRWDPGLTVAAWRREDEGDEQERGEIAHPND